MAEVADILHRIVERRRLRIAASRTSGTEARGYLGSPPGRTAAGERFLHALRSATGRAVIAEVKLGSPRLGSLVGTIDPRGQAQIYAANGAVCLSVVVEPDFFFGSYDLLGVCREASGLPVLAKDFVVDEIQLDWAAGYGADAVLLIAALLSDEELLRLSEAARRRGLVPLVECHSQADLSLLRGRDWELVGINNRDLKTFEVDLQRSIRLLPAMPASALKVAESGIGSGQQVEELAAAGFEAFLVGESLLLAEDVGASLRELVGSASHTE